MLVEVHTREELYTALSISARILTCTNNCNLTTFEVDLATTEELREEKARRRVTLVSESGLKTQADTRRVHAVGCQAILVGESLMRTGDVAGQSPRRC